MGRQGIRAYHLQLVAYLVHRVAHGPPVTNRTVVDNVTGASAPFPDGSGQDSELNAEGNSFGWNFGVGWQGRTPVEGLYYSVGVGVGGSSFDEDPVEIDRTAFRPRIGLVYQF